MRFEHLTQLCLGIGVEGVLLEERPQQIVMQPQLHLPQVDVALSVRAAGESVKAHAVVGRIHSRLEEVHDGFENPYQLPSLFCAVVEGFQPGSMKYPPVN